MLNGRLTLHGEDAEDLARRVLANYCRRTHSKLNPADTEDALAYLIATAWELAEFHYDPKRGGRFDSYAYSILSFRVTDWLRGDEGRTRWQFATHTYEPERPTVLSLDGPAHTAGDERAPVRLGELVAVHDSRDATDSAAALERLERERHRHRARDKHALRQRLSEATAA